MFIASLLAAAAIGWSGVSPENHLGGRPASPGYLQGKVILLDCRDYAVATNDTIRLEQLWRTFKAKPFVVVGSHLGSSAAAARSAIARFGVSYPVYAGARLAAKDYEPVDGYYTVVNASGLVVVKTRDLHRAEAAVVTAIANDASPGTVKLMRRYLDYELAVLPGKAYNRLKDFRRRFPREAAAYDAEWDRLDSNDEACRLARLEDVVRQVRDSDERRRGAFTKAKVAELIAAYEDLRKSKDPLVMQEAKNCIAELKWAAASLKEE